MCNTLAFLNYFVPTILLVPMYVSIDMSIAMAYNLLNCTDSCVDLSTPEYSTTIEFGVNMSTMLRMQFVKKWGAFVDKALCTYVD